MAKKTQSGKRKVNKSQAIRDYLAKHPNAMPKEIIADLRTSGTRVSPALVSAVKYGEKKGKRRKKAVGRAKPGRKSITAEDLMQAKGLADQLGGVERAKTILETLEKLT